MATVQQLISGSSSTCEFPVAHFHNIKKEGGGCLGGGGGGGVWAIPPWTFVRGVIFQKSQKIPPWVSVRWGGDLFKWLKTLAIFFFALPRETQTQQIALAPEIQYVTFGFWGAGYTTNFADSWLSVKHYQNTTPCCLEPCSNDIENVGWTQLFFSYLQSGRSWFWLSTTHKIIQGIS